MNGLPASSYYEVSSSYWNLIYKEPPNQAITQTDEGQLNESDKNADLQVSINKTSKNKTTTNAFNKA